MDRATREFISQIQGKNFDEIKRIIKKMPEGTKNHLLSLLKTREDYEILKTSERFGELRDKILAAEMYVFLDSQFYSKYTDDPFVVRKLSGEDFREFGEVLEKRNMKRIYQNSTIKTLKTKYKAAYDGIIAAFQEEDMDADELEYIGSSKYIYRNAVLINFTYSPMQVSIEWLI